MLTGLYDRDNEILSLCLFFLVKALDLCLSVQINLVFCELQIPLKK